MLRCTAWMGSAAFQSLTGLDVDISVQTKTRGMGQWGGGGRVFPKVFSFVLKPVDRR